MTGGHTCSADCTRGWGPTGRSHCRACGASFTTWRNFDRHRKGGNCLTPELVGLELNDRGLWQQPGPEEDVR